MALEDVFRTALAGRCNARPELAADPIPLEIHVPARAVPRRGPNCCAAVRAAGLAGRGDADRAGPGDSRVGRFALPRRPRWPATLRLADALNHLYVLLPVLDDAKHYWVSNDEVDKLIRAAGLAGGPPGEGR